MRQHRNLSAYLNLVQALINCPRGEEWELLRRNESLVNPELLTVMEEVAAQLLQEGDGQTAKFLRYWEAQLAHVLAQESETSPNSPIDDRLQTSLKLIQALLDCPKGAEAELLNAHAELLTPEFVQLMQQVAVQLNARGNQEAANFLQQWARELRQALNRSVADRSAEMPPAPVSDPSTTVPSAADHPAAVHSAAAHSAATHAEQPVVPMPSVIFPEEGSHAPAQPLIQPLIQPFMPPTTARTSGSSVHSIPSAPPPPEQPPQEPPQEPPLALSQESQPSVASLEQQVAAIAQSLAQLEATIASRLQPFNPLWYMQVLEQAATENWLLSTEEVEHLIGVKPKCYSSQTAFQRGCWTFVKTGKMGAQTGWRVMKSINFGNDLEDGLEANLPGHLQSAGNSYPVENPAMESQAKESQAKPKEEALEDDVWAVLDSV